MLNAVTDIDKPAFVIRLDGPELLDANAAARDLWGIASATELPFAIDANMPALRDILSEAQAAAPNATTSRPELHQHLVFWTHRGAQRLASHYQLSQDGANVIVIIEDAVAPNQSTPAPVTPARAVPAPAMPATDEAAIEPADPAPTPTNALDLRTMAHELRTPIGAVIALADMIDQEPFGSLGDPRYREYARDIRDSAHLALNIVAAALERDEGEEGILLGGNRELDLEALLHKARRALRLNARSAGLAIDIQTPPDMPHLLANAPGLNQILLNLIANAIKFTPPGGHISLAAAPTPSGGLEIFVTDTGIGMTEYETSVLVEPTTTSENSRTVQSGQRTTEADPPTPPQADASSPPAAPAPNTVDPQSALEKPRHRGIGFTLVRRLAAAMGATLTVTSQRGVGTRVAVTFPASHVIPKPQTGDNS